MQSRPRAAGEVLKRLSTSRVLQQGSQVTLGSVSNENGKMVQATLYTEVHQRLATFWQTHMLCSALTSFP
jgi:hypothetical protein